jgi:hypothetical protein
MKRRDFLTASTAGIAALGPLAAGLEAHEDVFPGKQFLELRRYSFDDPQKQKAVLQFGADAAIAAVNRAGVEPVGVFTETEAEEDDMGVWVLLPHNSIASAVTLTRKLAADDMFLEAADEYLNRPFSEPLFKRVESSLLLGFDQMPIVECPVKSESRIFQLRVYPSPTELAAYRKVEMFNEGGEIAIFRRVGLTPVFFGETLYGGNMPNLTYMLGFDNEAAKEAAWEKFLSDPAWEALKAEERYKKTVFNISNIMLKPAACSQI